MGCLNSTKSFKHWFGNIHFSGPCNRSCYFCIGQHMQELERLNNLNKWPLDGIGEFVLQLREREITEVNLTGSNTDPLLYQHLPELIAFLRDRIKSAVIGLRTNGVKDSPQSTWDLFDKASVSIHTLTPTLNQTIMGSDVVADVPMILRMMNGKPLKVNIVLCPETEGMDIIKTINLLIGMGIKSINLREPYGQPHIGNPIYKKPQGETFGCPTYDIDGCKVVYWDVHYCEVESVNLYANGIVSDDYPVTRGYSDIEGKVLGQEHWNNAGRQYSQWVTLGDPKE